MDLDNQMKLIWAGLSSKGYSVVFQSTENPKFALVLSFSGFTPGGGVDGHGMTITLNSLSYEIRDYGPSVRPYWEPGGFGKAFARMLVLFARERWPSFKDLAFDFGPSMKYVLGKDGAIDYY